MKKVVANWCNSVQRGIQRTEECLGQASATEITYELQRLMDELDAVNERNMKIVEATEKMLKQNPGLTSHEYIYQSKEKKNPTRTNALLQLGNEMIFAGRQFGESTTYGKCLLVVGGCEEELGHEELRFVTQIAMVFLTPLRRFMDTDLHHAIKERRTLFTSRLDLDAARRRLKKARLPDKQAQAEGVLRSHQAQYERQLELTKLACENVQREKVNQIRYLLKFVDVQLDFFTKNVQVLQAVKTELLATLKGEKGMILDPQWPTLNFENNLMENHKARGIPMMNDLETVETVETNPSTDHPHIAVPLTPSSVASHSPSPLLVQGRVLGNFQGQTASEVTVAKDEMVEVIRTGKSTGDTDWSLVKKASGQLGYVPREKVQILENPEVSIAALKARETEVTEAKPSPEQTNTEITGKPSQSNIWAWQALGRSDDW